MDQENQLEETILAKNLAHRIAIFGGLSPQEMSAVIPLLEKVIYDKDAVVFRQGDMPHAIYIVRSGTIHIVMDDQRKGNLDIISFKAGDCFGETSLIGIQPHTASAVARDRAEVFVISSERLFSLRTGHMDVFAKIILNIARESCRRLHHADEVLYSYMCAKKKDGPRE